MVGRGSEGLADRTTQTPKPLLLGVQEVVGSNPAGPIAFSVPKNRKGCTSFGRFCIIRTGIPEDVGTRSLTRNA
jgi:hypothetical protein